MLSQTRAAKADGLLDSRIMGERRRNKSERRDHILNFDWLLGLTIVGSYTPLFPLPILTFFSVIISVVIFDLLMLFRFRRFSGYPPLLSEPNTEI
jgi:hypothetical protein